MANIDNVQLPDGSSYNIVDNTSGFATQNYVDSAVSSVTKTTIGLGNVDNTSDLNKPISTATQTALDTLDEDKADKTDIATVESRTTASRAYSVGELVYVSGTLYRVKTAIASGATFTAGTNIKVANVSNAIKNATPYMAKMPSIAGSTIDDFFQGFKTAILNKCSVGQGFIVALDWSDHRTFLMQGIVTSSTGTSFIATTPYDNTHNWCVSVNSSVLKAPL